jgi:CrcB protein
MPAWVYVGAGGFLGAIARWALSGFVTRATGATFPWGTLTVNVLGSLLIGLLMGLVEFRGLLTAEARAFLVIGGLGAFTTFSTFSHETLALLRTGQFGLGAANAIGSVLACLTATAIGWAIAKAMV